MNQLFALGAMIAVGIVFTFLSNPANFAGDTKSQRDAVYAMMKTNSRDVSDAIEVAARHCVGKVYYQAAPQYFREVAVAAYLSTLRIPGVPSGKPPTDEAIKKQMSERIEVSWKSYARRVKNNVGEKEREFFSAIQSFHKGNTKVNDCVFEKANEYLLEKGLQES